MARGKHITPEIIGKIMVMANLGMTTEQIRKVLGESSHRSIAAYICAVRAAERGEREIYLSRCVWQKALQEYCELNGLNLPEILYSREEEKPEPEQMQINVASPEPVGYDYTGKLSELLQPVIDLIVRMVREQVANG